ncbi:hypothetical protein A3K63_01360 [Candidatus Micrarchaeota archaeon RBG_16_49_10]|nr:MAG: hypothetical protein A3K63_01360 [Candidatus Micrarchaeota archaeon RBG_16_49_10]
MPSKGIAIHATYVVAFVVITIILSFLVIYKSLDIIGKEATRTSCMRKLTKYCQDWGVNNYNAEPYSWDDTEPKECETLEIYKPTKEECEEF